jgi:hypothetical protein
LLIGLLDQSSAERLFTSAGFVPGYEQDGTTFSDKQLIPEVIASLMRMTEGTSGSLPYFSLRSSAF